MFTISLTGNGVACVQLLLSSSEETFIFQRNTCNYYSAWTFRLYLYYRSFISGLSLARNFFFRLFLFYFIFFFLIRFLKLLTTKYTNAEKKESIAICFWPRRIFFSNFPVKFCYLSSFVIVVIWTYKIGYENDKHKFPGYYVGTCFINLRRNPPFISKKFLSSKPKMVVNAWSQPLNVHGPYLPQF